MSLFLELIDNLFGWVFRIIWIIYLWLFLGWVIYVLVRLFENSWIIFDDIIIYSVIFKFWCFVWVVYFIFF